MKMARLGFLWVTEVECVDNVALMRRIIDVSCYSLQRTKLFLPLLSGEGRNPVNPKSPALRDKSQLHFE